MPWNAKSDARKLGPGIPKSDFWASAKEGIDQVGCVSAHGQFDEDGVLFGRPRTTRRSMRLQQSTDVVKTTRPPGLRPGATS